MKHLTIIFPGEQSNFSTVACIAGTFEIIATANSYRRNTGKKDLFTVQLAGVGEKKEMNGGMFTVKPQANISALAKPTSLLFLRQFPFTKKPEWKTQR